MLDGRLPYISSYALWEEERSSPGRHSREGLSLLETTYHVPSSKGTTPDFILASIHPKAWTRGYMEHVGVSIWGREVSKVDTHTQDQGWT